VQRSPVHPGIPVKPEATERWQCATCGLAIEPVDAHYRHLPTGGMRRGVSDARLVTPVALADALHLLFHEHGDLWPTCRYCLDFAAEALRRIK